MSMVTHGAGGGADQYVGHDALTVQAQLQIALGADDCRQNRRFVSKLAATTTCSTSRRAYESTLRCGVVANVSDDGVRRPYRCGRPWCHRCARARYGRRLYPYIDGIRQAGDYEGGLQFVTLTVPPCKQAALPGVIDEMVRARGQVLKQANAAARRRGGKLVYFWKLEGAFTHKNGLPLYRPHLHLIVAGGAEIAGDLVERWLACYPDARREYQHVQDITAAEKPYDVGENEPEVLTGLEGVLRYMSKGVVKHDLDLVREVDVMYRALHGRHVYGATRGLKDTAAERATPAEGPLALDRAAFEFGPDGVVDLVTGEVIAYDDGRLDPDRYGPAG